MGSKWRKRWLAPSFHGDELGLLGGIKDTGNKRIYDVHYTLKIRHGGLQFGPYTGYQKVLSDRVIWLRDVLGLTFLAVAKRLIGEGYKSPRGISLGAESVFSIYKKRKIRDTRLGSPSRIAFNE